MKSRPFTLSGQSPTEHVVEFEQSPHQWRLQFWSSDAALDRFEAESERIRIHVENIGKEPLEYHPQVDGKPLVIQPGGRALVFDDSIWELTMVNRSVEVEQTILSSTDRPGSLKLIFEPELAEGRKYRFDVSLRRTVNKG